MKKPNYGIDAPAILKNYLIFGSICLGAVDWLWTRITDSRCSSKTYQRRQSPWARSMGKCRPGI